MFSNLKFQFTLRSLYYVRWCISYYDKNPVANSKNNKRIQTSFRYYPYRITFPQRGPEIQNTGNIDVKYKCKLAHNASCYSNLKISLLWGLEITMTLLKLQQRVTFLFYVFYLRLCISSSDTTVNSAIFVKSVNFHTPKQCSTLDA